MKQTGFGQRLEKLKSFIDREIHVLGIGVVSYAGVLCFFTITDMYFDNSLDSYRLPAFIITLLLLRKIWRKTHNSDEPLLIQLAAAFREGFFSVYEFLPTLVDMINQVKTGIEKLKKKL